MTEPTAHTSDHSSTPPTTPLKVDPYALHRIKVMGPKIKTAQDNWAKSKSKQNNTPDYNKHAHSTPTSADVPASPSTHDWSSNPSTIPANTTELPIDDGYLCWLMNEHNSFSYIMLNLAPPQPMEDNPDTSNSTHEPVTPTTSTLPPNPTYSHVDMTDAHPTFIGTATEHDSPPTPSTTPLKTTEQPGIDIFPDLVALSTSQPTPEQDLAHDCDDIVDLPTLTPGPPSVPPPCTSRTPAPPPSDTQTENGPPDDKGITWCSDGSYKVTVKCIYCRITHKTGPSNHHDPYTELRNIGWTQGKSRSGNHTWQFPRCPDWSAGRNCIPT